MSEYAYTDDGTHSTRHLLLQALLIHEDNVTAFLTQLSQLAAQVVEPSVSCGVTTRIDGNYFTIAASDERANAVDETQYQAHQGPCLHTFATGEVVDMPDVAADTRWPIYVDRAIKQGLRSSLSLPLEAQDQVIGALNLYNFLTTHAFDGDAHRQLELFAAQASAALALSVRQARHAATRAQLEEALSSRSIIDQALGILMAQQDCDADEAFALLRRHSQHNNRKLRNVAADLVERISGKPAKPPPDFDYGQN